jgi:sortase (surface protein transpeptidase)
VLLLVVGFGALGVAGAGLAGVRLPERGGSVVDARWGPPAPLTGAAALAAPTRLRIPAIGVDTPLEQLALGPDGALAAPADFDHAGWYAGGPAPGDPGPAVLAGHVDSTRGPAVFAQLRTLPAGAQILVDRSGQWLSFRVVEVRRYPKDTFPTTRVYGPTPGAELRLITCGGDFDRRAHSYVDNVVVYAVVGG